MDKIALQEDRKMQEHLHFETVENLWNLYKKEQMEILHPDERKLRSKENFYPDKEWAVHYRDLNYTSRVVQINAEFSTTGIVLLVSL